MKAHWDEKVPHLIEASSADQDVETGEMAMTAEAEEVKPVMEQHLIYDVVTPEVVWDCTNCRACMEHCPVFIEHIPKIVEMRRNPVM